MTIKIPLEVWREVSTNTPRPWTDQAVAVDLAYWIKLQTGPSVAMLCQRWGWEPSKAVAVVKDNPEAAAALMGEPMPSKPKPKAKAPTKRKRTAKTAKKQ